MTPYQLISNTLLPLGWRVHSMNEFQFHQPREGKALYVYPDKNLIKYYPDIRSHSNVIEHEMTATQDQILALIALG